MPDKSPTRYYPTEHDLSSPARTRAVLQQILIQHYALADAHAQLQAQHEALLQRVGQIASVPHPSGPTNTRLLGLPVLPVDMQSLADGSKLVWDKANGVFKFVP